MRKIYVIGEINTAAYKEFSYQVDQLAADSKEPIIVELHSEGGLAADAVAFYGKIKNCPCPVHIIVYGMCHSSATLICAAGDRREADAAAQFMTHEATETIEGSASRILAEAKRMQEEEKLWNKLLERETGTPAFFWDDINKAETYLTAQQALQYGLIDAIRKGKQK